MEEPELVSVKRNPRDWQEASYREDQISDPHWSATSGGVRRGLGGEKLCGYVVCNEAVYGEVAHSGIHKACPHTIKVCIIKKGSAAGPYKRLRQEADEKRARKLGKSLSC